MLDRLRIFLPANASEAITSTIATAMATGGIAVVTWRQYLDDASKIASIIASAAGFLWIVYQFYDKAFLGRRRGPEDDEMIDF
jgi:hypothetical protein